MQDGRLRWWVCVAAGGMSMLSAGCGAAVEAHPPRSVYVARPPPEPLPEFKSGPAAEGMAWIPGYWHFHGTDYVWIPGHWEVPRPGFQWSPPQVLYSSERRTWVYVLGRWQPQAPAAPANAKAVR